MLVERADGVCRSINQPLKVVPVTTQCIFQPFDRHLVVCAPTIPATPNDRVRALADMFSRNEKRKLHQLFVHRCQLPATEDLLIHYISSGYFVDVRRRFRRFFICNEDNPRSKLFLKSTAAINDEKWKNLQYNFYMIHPFSRGR